MKWFQPLSGDAFGSWLLALTGGARVSQGRPLDPFATSMRNFTHAFGWLTLVEEGRGLPGRGGSGGQDETDLKAAGLVESEDGRLVLTDLGRFALQGWRKYGIGDENLVSELSRCLVVVKGALVFGVPRYVEMIDFWREIREVAPIEPLLDQSASLYLLSYLNTEIGGFNPWEVLRVTPGAVADLSTNDWSGLEAAIRHRGEPTVQALAKLKDRVEGFATRGDGRVVFCMAMDLAFSVTLDVGSTLDRLNRWRIPQ